MDVSALLCSGWSKSQPVLDSLEVAVLTITIFQLTHLALSHGVTKEGYICGAGSGMSAHLRAVTMRRGRAHEASLGICYHVCMYTKMERKKQWPRKVVHDCHELTISSTSIIKS